MSDKCLSKPTFVHCISPCISLLATSRPFSSNSQIIVHRRIQRIPLRLMNSPKLLLNQKVFGVWGSKIGVPVRLAA